MNQPGHIVLADIFRVIELVLASGAVGVTLIVIREYAIEYRQRRHAAKAAGWGRWRALLPQHVALLGLSFLMLTVLSMVEVVLRFHDPLGWRAPVYIVMYAIGLWAMWVMLKYQRVTHGDTPRPMTRNRVLDS